MHRQSLYRFVWQVSRRGQVPILLLTLVIAPLSMAPLELQRRIVDQALGDRQLELLAALGGLYLFVVLAQGGLKYVLNLMKGQVLEDVARHLRTLILERVKPAAVVPPAQTAIPGAPPRILDEGTIVAMLAAETEDIAGFASDSLAMPMMQVGTIVWVAGYLLWVEPAIAVLAAVVYLPQVILVPRVQGAINRLGRRRTYTVRKLGRDVVAHDDAGGPERTKLRRRAGLLINQIYRLRLRIYRRKFFLTFLGNFLDSLGPIIVLSVGGYLVIEGRTEISTLVVFISGFQKLSDPWDQLVTFYRSISNTRVTYGLVADALAPHPAG